MMRRQSLIPILFGIALPLAACAAAPSGEPAPPSARPLPGRGTPERLNPPIPLPETEVGLPDGAIRRGPDFYLVPLGRDADGCLAYRPFSRKHVVAQVIYYADGKGGFVMDKNQADCSKIKPK